MAKIERVQFQIPRWNVEELCGYKPQTTFWYDFSIADAFGVAAVRDTYNRAFEGWKGNVVYLTELVMVLNHKIWAHYGKRDDLAKVYDELWREADGYCCDNLKGDDWDYYYEITD